jgi:hypothetical protein
MAVRRVIGYHGTTLGEAGKIVDGIRVGALNEPVTAVEANWLGAGIYFFENDMAHAEKWARVKASKAGMAGAIVRAEIELINCLDVTHILGQTLLRNAHRALQEEWKASPDGRRNQMPFEILGGQVRAGYRGEWRNYGKNELDYRVVEKAVELAHAQLNVTYNTVRGIFLEDGPLYENSWFFEGAHAAIAVRSPYKSIHDASFWSL